MVYFFLLSIILNFFTILRGFLAALWTETYFNGLKRPPRPKVILFFFCSLQRVARRRVTHPVRRLKSRHSPFPSILLFFKMFPGFYFCHPFPPLSETVLFPRFLGHKLLCDEPHLDEVPPFLLFVGIQTSQGFWFLSTTRQNHQKVHLPRRAHSTDSPDELCTLSVLNQRAELDPQGMC